MNVLDEAIYSALSGDSGAGGVATLATGGIFNGRALDAVPTYVVFEELVDNPGYAFGNSVQFDYIPYVVRAFAVDDVNGGNSGPRKAGTLVDRSRALLLNPILSITGKTLLTCRMLRSTNPTDEWDESQSRFIYGRGTIFDIWVA